MAVFLLVVFFLVTSLAEGSVFSIIDTTVGGTLAAKRIQNDDTGETSFGCIYTSMHYRYIANAFCYAGEYVETIVDFGGRVEDLVLKSRSTGVMRKVLLTHHNNATAVLENSWWKGMLLLPWANRIAYVRPTFVS